MSVLSLGSTPDTWLRLHLNKDLAQQEGSTAKLKELRLVPKVRRNPYLTLPILIVNMASLYRDKVSKQVFY